MSNVDRLFQQIPDRAKAAAGEEVPRLAPEGLGMGLRASDVPCGLCSTGWAEVDLMSREHPEGIPACPRCAERRRCKAATYGLDGPVVYRRNPNYTRGGGPR